MTPTQWSIAAVAGSNDQNFHINVDNVAIAGFNPNTLGVQPDGTLIYAPGEVNAEIDPNITAVTQITALLISVLCKAERASG